jgi:hypothetical protein
VRWKACGRPISQIFPAVYFVLGRYLLPGVPKRTQSPGLLYFFPTSDERTAGIKTGSAQQKGELWITYWNGLSAVTSPLSFTPSPILGLILSPYGFLRSQRSREFYSLHLAVVRQYGRFPLPLVSVQITESSVATLFCGSASYHAIKLARKKSFPVDSEVV